MYCGKITASQWMKSDGMVPQYWNWTSSERSGIHCILVIKILVYRVYHNKGPVHVVLVGIACALVFWCIVHCRFPRHLSVLPGTITGFLEGIVGSMILSNDGNVRKDSIRVIKLIKLARHQSIPSTCVRGRQTHCGRQESVKEWSAIIPRQRIFEMDWREEYWEKWTGDKRPRNLASWKRRFTSMEGLECKKQNVPRETFFVFLGESQMTSGSRRFYHLVTKRSATQRAEYQVE